MIGEFLMKKFVLFFLLIIALTGCGLNQNTNSNKTESNATSSAAGSSTSAAGKAKRLPSKMDI